MTATCQDTAAKQMALAKLLLHGPETRESLVRLTGWGTDTTLMTLLQLVVAGTVKSYRGQGAVRFGLRDVEAFKVVLGKLDGAGVPGSTARSTSRGSPPRSTPPGEHAVRAGGAEAGSTRAALASPLNLRSVDLDDPATCVGCGCTDRAGCDGGCWWLAVRRGPVGKGVCSRCQDWLPGFLTSEPR